MRSLSIDIGNTFTKLAVFEGRELVHYERLAHLDAAYLTSLIETFKPAKSVVSAVSGGQELLENVLNKQTNYTRFSVQINKGVVNKYKTPQTLGLDRWAVILAANGLFAPEACLIIDAGTCITYDLLNSKAEYSGGSISPGLAMRFTALHQFTGRLPLVDWQETENIPDGEDTQSAIKNGVLQGVVNEIEGFITLNNKKERTLKVILTGGDANFLYKQLQNSIFAPQIIKDPHLVLKGLNEAIAD